MLHQEAGAAGGVTNVAHQIGGSLGLAVLASLSTTRSDNLLASGDSSASALTGGYQLAFAVGAGLVILAIVLAAIFLRSPAEAAEVEAMDAEASLEEAA